MGIKFLDPFDKKYKHLYMTTYFFRMGVTASQKQSKCIKMS